MEPEEQQRMVLHMMSEMVRLGKVIGRLGCVRGARGKVAEEGGKLNSLAGTVCRRRTLPRWRSATRRLWKLQVCRWGPAGAAVTVLLVRSVEHPTSPDCLQLTMFTFKGAARQLLW